MCVFLLFFFFFFNDTATTEIYTLSLHDALPISNGARQGDDAGPAHLSRAGAGAHRVPERRAPIDAAARAHADTEDRKSTRLNSSHGYISYAVFCLKKKKKKTTAKYAGDTTTSLT